MREDLKDAYKTLSDYDRHYSTVRATLAIFLFSLSYGIASFLLKDAKEALSGPGIVFIASMVPILFLVTALLLSCFFQRLTHACRIYMEGLEQQREDQNPSESESISLIIPEISIEGTVKPGPDGLSSFNLNASIPKTVVQRTFSDLSGEGHKNVSPIDLTQVRLHLNRLVDAHRLLRQERGDDFTKFLSTLLGQSVWRENDIPTGADRKKSLADLEARISRLPRFISWDAPNQILAVALVLLLFFPCVTLTIQAGSTINYHNLLPLAVPVTLAFLIVIKRFQENRLQKARLAFAFISVPCVVLSWLFCFTTTNHSSQGLTPNNSEAKRKCREGLVQIDSPIESFLSGEHSQLENNAGLDALLTTIEDLSSQNCPLPIATFIIGSADRRHLEGKRELVYGDNTGLARARAEFVATEIRKRLHHNGTTKIALVTLITGPKWHGSEHDANIEKEMSHDRSVTVYGLWAITPSASIQH